MPSTRIAQTTAAKHHASPYSSDTRLSPPPGAPGSSTDIRSTANLTRTTALELREHANDDRLAAERYIGRHYFETFGSSIHSFMPRLFSLRDENGDICAAFGLRAATGKLFLEQYLDVAIEDAIATHAGRSCERQTIVEVGHLSGSFPGAMRTIIRLLTPLLHGEGFQWVAFTGTVCLRNAFHRMGLAPIEVQLADSRRLPSAERAAWGTYYLQAPRVLVGNIEQGHHALILNSSQAWLNVRRTS